MEYRQFGQTGLKVSAIGFGCWEMAGTYGPFDETMQALEEIVEQGKVRYVGLSNFTPREIETCVEARRVDVLQYGCNLFDRRMAKWIFPYAQEQGIGVMTYGSLAYGMLTGALTEVSFCVGF